MVWRLARLARATVPAGQSAVSQAADQSAKSAIRGGDVSCTSARLASPCTAKSRSAPKITGLTRSRSDQSSTPLRVANGWGCQDDRAPKQAYFSDAPMSTMAPCGPSATALGDTGMSSNRPFGVKRFQTNHHSVDVAHGLVLLFGIGTKALPSWDSKTRRTIFGTALPSDERQVQADIRSHLIHRPARDIIPPLGGARVSSYRV